MLYGLKKINVLSFFSILILLTVMNATPEQIITGASANDCHLYIESKTADKFSVENLPTEDVDTSF
jgi:hypothetical protein